MKNIVSDLVTKIGGDPSRTKNAIRKEAEAVLSSKKAERFFTELYDEIFEREDLTNRCFVNIGPGSFRHRYWTNVDKTYGDQQTWADSRGHRYTSNIDVEWDVMDHAPLDIPDGSINVVYCSHLIEHLFEDDANWLFSEVLRILKPGGVFRIVTPDARLAVDAWVRRDWYYLAQYYWIIDKKRNWREYKEYIHKRPAYCLLDQFSLLTRSENSTHVDWREADSFIRSYRTPYDALTAASRLSDKDLNRKLGRHVNWFDYRKVKKLLDDIGFSSVTRSGYGQSLSPVLRDTRRFDKTDPFMSLYVDSVK